MKEYLVEWQEYNKNTTETSIGKFQETVEAESEEEAIELVKQYILDETDKQEYPNIEIIDCEVDLGETIYINFTAKELYK